MEPERSLVSANLCMQYMEIRNPSTTRPPNPVVAAYNPPN